MGAPPYGHDFAFRTPLLRSIIGSISQAAAVLFRCPECKESRPPLRLDTINTGELRKAARDTRAVMSLLAAHRRIELTIHSAAARHRQGFLVSAPSTCNS